MLHLWISCALGTVIPMVNQTHPDTDTYNIWQGLKGLLPLQMKTLSCIYYTAHFLMMLLCLLIALPSETMISFTVGGANIGQFVNHCHVPVGQSRRW